MVQLIVIGQRSNPRSQAASSGVHPFLGEFGDRYLGLFESCESPRFSNVVGLGELDLLIGNDLNTVPLRVVEGEPTRRGRLDIHCFETLLDEARIVSDEPEVAVVV